jgi:hypothetical protein
MLALYPLRGYYCNSNSECATPRDDATCPFEPPPPKRAPKPSMMPFDANINRVYIVSHVHEESSYEPITHYYAFITRKRVQVGPVIVRQPSPEVLS